MTTPMLFEANGRPLVFALRECVERNSIKQLIEVHGGELTGKWTPGVIHLETGAPKSLAVFSKPKDHAVYSLQFVRDATAQKALPSLDAYTFRSPTIDPLETESNKEGYKGRNKFTQAEEEVMTQYMKRYQGSYTSLAYWTKALLQGIGIERSANTLRDHCKRMMEGKTVAREELRKGEEAKKKAEREASATPKPMKKPKIGENPASPLGIPKATSAFTPFSPPKPIMSPSPTVFPRVQTSTPAGVYRTAEPSTGKSSHYSVLSSASPRKLSERFETNCELMITFDSKRGRSVIDYKKSKDLCHKAHIFEQLTALCVKCLKKEKPTRKEEAEVVKVLISKCGDVASTLEHFA